MANKNWNNWWDTYSQSIKKAYDVSSADWNKYFSGLKPPEYPAASSFTPSTLDWGRVQQITQLGAQPAIGELRGELRSALGGVGRGGNIIEKQYKTRGALEGFGKGMAQAISSARPTALSLAEQERKSAEQANLLKYTGDYYKQAQDWKTKMEAFNTLLNAYLEQIQADASAKKARKNYLGISYMPSVSLPSSSEPTTSGISHAPGGSVEEWNKKYGLGSISPNITYPSLTNYIEQGIPGSYSPYTSEYTPYTPESTSNYSQELQDYIKALGG